MSDRVTKQPEIFIESDNIGSPYSKSSLVNEAFLQKEKARQWMGAHYSQTVQSFRVCLKNDIFLRQQDLIYKVVMPKDLIE